MKLHIAICDDSAADTAYLSALVQEWSKTGGHTVRIREYPSAENFLFHFEDDSSDQFLLLDIEMGQMNGVELAKRIREKNDTVQIAFITGYPDFISEGYEVSALHYLMKPVKREKLFEVLDKGAANLCKVPEYVLLPLGKETLRLSADSIVYAESDGHYVLLHAGNEVHRLRMTIPEIAGLLGGDFARCGRSCVVGLRYVQRITKETVYLETGDQIPLGKGYFDDLNRALIQYLRGK